MSVAFDADMLDADPTWTVIDTLTKVAQIQVRDGRQSELDQTEAGTCTVFLHDTTGLFDPNNASSPYFGKLDGKPVAVAVYDPVSEEWVPQWRGFIDDWRYRIEPVIGPDGKPILANIKLECVDMFDYLARAEMAPGVDGKNTAGVDGAVDADVSDGAVQYSAQSVKERIEDILEDAGVPDGLSVVFTGNVNVQRTIYDLDDSYLSALRDAADAEFPTVANCYVDKLGRFVFHGRLARFDPEATAAGATPGAWVFTRWKAGDGTAVQADSENAQIREFTYARSRSSIINKATCYPEGTDEADVPGQVVVDSASIGSYGIHAWSAENLIVDEGTTTGNDALTECLLFAAYQVANLAQPLNRVETITFKTLRPDDPRAAATWPFLTGVSISDVVTVSVGYPGGTGVQATDYYVEGREMTVTPLQPGFDMVVLSLNLSPAAWWSEAGDLFGDS